MFGHFHTGDKGRPGTCSANAPSALSALLVVCVRASKLSISTCGHKRVVTIAEERLPRSLRLIAA